MAYKLEKHFPYGIKLGAKNETLELKARDSIRTVTVPARNFTVRTLEGTALVDIDFRFDGKNYKVIGYNRITKNYKELNVENGA